MTTNEPQTITLPVKDAQAIVNYLQHRPYVEAAPLIHSLLRAGQIAPAPQPPKENA